MEPVDHTIARRAVASFAAQPNQVTALEVLRSCMFGDLPLRNPNNEHSRRRRATAMPDGSAGLFVFTSAPEVVTYNAADAVMSSTTIKAVEMARNDGYGGLVNPRGPYVVATLAELSS
ncbi:SseB family protein [Mycobacterium sp. shizuoka-1]|uniref:SseB family protein n=1 Tax=Mycobacterium sp. shizuoka-1 TaxID=2039281 RepID=UPI000C066589|nr:SseB family protein [Mycobacterium sp. shizuoka-1]GAY19017.1 hypothetical protein MSZK_57430 [Mycobacterium sp. shizuoka-1]